MKNKNYKLYKNIKKAIAIGLSAVVVSSGGLVAMIHNYSTGSSNNSIVDSDDNDYSYYVDEDDGYLDITLSNEKKVIEYNKISNKINKENFDYKNVIETIESYNFDFSMSEYYELNNNIQLYEDSNYNKKENFLVVTNGKIDSNKLYNIVIKNNEEYMSQDRNSINVFFSETSNSYIKSICDLIAKTYNNSNEEYLDINKVSDTLSHLKIFQNNTTSASAYVNDELVFVFNPTMIDMFSDMNQMRGNVEENVSIEKTVFVHEIQHLFQNSSNDFNNDNGIEVGFCRKYQNVNVNSLWSSWLLEGSAELKMSEVLDVTPKNYDKKISYIRSYNISRMFEDNYDIDSLVNASFSDNLAEAYNLLGIKSDKEKNDFLELMYSIEITQSDVSDFWKYYETKNNVILTEEEKEALRMNIRDEVIKKLSENFYKGLVKNIGKGKINDIETVFFMLRLWELDCCNHLDYTSNKGLQHSKDFISYASHIEKTLFEELSISSDMSYDKIVKAYNNYHMIISNNGNNIINADFSAFNEKEINYIKNAFDSYSITHFARINTMSEYINAISKTKN